MLSNKTRIIKRQGSTVTIVRYLGDTVVREETKALIGRANRVVTNMVHLESYKQGIFLPDSGVDGGDFVKSPALNEMFVVSGTHQEMYNDKVISIVANLLKCNHILTIKGLERVADNRGNIRNETVTRYDGVPCFVEQVTSELRQLEAGIHPDTEYRIYTTSLEVKETDQVMINIRGKEEKFKVVHNDFVTFPKMLVLEVCSDVRK